jgi:hypothetical protein
LIPIFFSETPYSGYILFIENFGIQDPQETQIAMLGYVRDLVGGIPFNRYSKSYFLGVYFGIVLLYA